MYLTREKAFAIYNQYQDEIREAAEAGELDVSQYNAMKDQAVADFNNVLAEIEDVDASSEEVEEDLTLNVLGQALVELADEQGYETIEDVIYDLADELGANDPNDVLDLMTDERVDEDDAYNFFVNTGVIDEGYDEDELDDEEDLDYELEDYDEDDEEDELEDEANYRIHELENQIANFQAEKDLLSIINRQQARAETLLESGNLPPVAYHKMFINSSGNIPMDDEKVAQFSAAAESRNTDVLTYLEGYDMILDMFEAVNLSETGMFNVMVDQYEANFTEDDPSEFDNIDYSATLSNLKI